MMLDESIPTGTETVEAAFSKDETPSESFQSLLQKRTDGDLSVTDEILTEAFRQTVPGLPEGSISFKITDRPIYPEYSITNPSPQFLAFQANEAGLKIVHKQPEVIIIDDSNGTNIGDGRFFAVGPAFTDLQSSDDYEYGRSMEDALGRYLDKLKERTTQMAIDNFIRADKALETAKALYRHYDHAVDNLARIIGINGHFQDQEGVVYQLAAQEWVTVKVKLAVVNRTRREGERTGDLSLTAARELGYMVEGGLPVDTIEKFPNVDKFLKKGIQNEEQNNVALEYARQLITAKRRSPAEDALLAKLTKAIESFEAVAYPEVGQTTTEKSPASMDLKDADCGFDPNDPDQKGIPADVKIPGTDDGSGVKTEFDKEFDAVEKQTKEPFSTAADER